MVEAVRRYARTLKGIKTTFEITVPIISTISVRADRTLEKYIKDNDIVKEIGETHTTFTIPLQKQSSFTRVRKRAESLDVAYFQLPKALLVGLVSAYDAFLGDVLQAAFYLKPDLLNSSQRQMTFKQLTAFKSLDEARQHLIEKEVESVIRASHSEQFEWMEKSFSIDLRKGLERWPVFIELTERRNLFVHANGIVSSQYLDVCRKNRVDVSNRSLNEVLVVPPEYFTEAWNCLFELGVKLAHVILRKLKPEALEVSDNALIDLNFELLNEGDFALAARILDFVVNGFPKHSSALNRKVLLINLCIGLKFSGKNNECLMLLDAQDFSDSDSKFILADIVLRDDFVKAAEIMRSIGPNGSVDRHSYESWPLFREFRKTREFQEEFKAMFGEEYVHEEKQPSPTDSSNKGQESFSSVNPEDERSLNRKGDEDSV